MFPVKSFPQSLSMWFVFFIYAMAEWTWMFRGKIGGIVFFSPPQRMSKRNAVSFSLISAAARLIGQVRIILWCE